MNKKKEQKSQKRERERERRQIEKKEKQCTKEKQKIYKEVTSHLHHKCNETLDPELERDIPAWEKSLGREARAI